MSVDSSVSQFQLRKVSLPCQRECAEMRLLNCELQLEMLDLHVKEKREIQLHDLSKPSIVRVRSNSFGPRETLFWRFDSCDREVLRVVILICVVTLQAVEELTRETPVYTDTEQRWVEVVRQDH